MDLLNTDLIKLEYVGGALLLLLFIWLSVRRIRWRRDTREDPRNIKIRQLLADVKLANQQLDVVQAELATRQAESEEALASLEQVRASLVSREEELDSVRKDLRDEVAKTRDLRQELTDQAQERLRETVFRKQAETELEVAQAGTEVVIDEFSRLQQEQEQKEAGAGVRPELKATDTHIDISLDEMLTEK